jgi:hypothetical protein
MSVLPGVVPPAVVIVIVLIYRMTRRVRRITLGVDLSE